MLEHLRAERHLKTERGEPSTNLAYPRFRGYARANRQALGSIMDRQALGSMLAARCLAAQFLGQASGQGRLGLIVATLCLWPRCLELRRRRVLTGSHGLSPAGWSAAHWKAEETARLRENAGLVPSME